MYGIVLSQGASRGLPFPALGLFLCVSVSVLALPEFLENGIQYSCSLAHLYGG